jgi:hypothetical protein
VVCLSWERCLMSFKDAEPWITAIMVAFFVLTWWKAGAK